MSDCVITNKAKRKTLEARAGIRNLSKIKGMAFGDGAESADGKITEPQPDENMLKNELLRKEIDKYDMVSDLCIRYICTLKRGELTGKKINEAALFDEEGDLVAIKTFLSKGKDADIQLIFQIDDMFEE